MSNLFRSIRSKRKGDTDTPGVAPAEASPLIAGVLREPLPVFDVGPLSEFPADVFASDDPELDAFVLTLALAFNDLKNLEWNYSVMASAAPDNPTVDAQAGQVYGMRVWATRFTFALIHELLEAIRLAVERGITSRPRFVTALERLVPDARNEWSRLSRIAVGHLAGEDWVDADALRWFVRVRNNLAYHYYQPKELLAGYNSFFNDDPKNDFNRAAYASFGKTMEQVRFFFADAAAGRPYQRDGERSPMNVANQLRHLVNAGLVVAVHAYLEQRRAEIA